MPRHYTTTMCVILWLLLLFIEFVSFVMAISYSVLCGPCWLSFHYICFAVNHFLFCFKPISSYVCLILFIPYYSPPYSHCCFFHIGLEPSNPPLSLPVILWMLHLCHVPRHFASLSDEGGNLRIAIFQHFTATVLPCPIFGGIGRNRWRTNIIFYREGVGSKLKRRKGEGLRHPWKIGRGGRNRKHVEQFNMVFPKRY